MNVYQPNFALRLALFISACTGILLWSAASRAQGQPAPAQGSQAVTSPPFVFRVQDASQHLEMTVQTSRLLTLDQKIPQVQVANPDILDITPMSPTQVQISAKRTGVTQVNLWTENKQIHTLDVVVMGDARELAWILRAKFPKTNLDVTPIGSAVMLRGFVDDQAAVPIIVTIAEQFFPKVINSMTVSGVQQTNLHVKVVEVSRTKVRELGFDWQHTNGSNMFMSGVSGLLSTTNTFGAASGAPDNALKFAAFPGGGATAFYGVLDALRQDSLGKVITEPDLVAMSGRPAYLLVGGEIGYQTTSGLTGPVVGFKEYGARLDFVPIVLGNGHIHLDIKAKVSAIDGANSVGGIPALTTRETETGVEMRSGQTFAIGGMVQFREESSNQGVPWLSELPYLGAAFRKVHHDQNEIELIVLVTPEIVDPMDPGQVPTCLPGGSTTAPSDWELFMKGHLEVPVCCPVPAPYYGPNVSPAAVSAAATAPTPNVPVTPARAAVAPAPATGTLALTPDNVGIGSTAAPAPTAPQNPSDRFKSAQVAQNSLPAEPGFIGPIGYEYVK